MREDLLDRLTKLDLSQNEARIYLALLETGLTTVTQLSKISKVHRVNVYDVLEKLQGKGLVSSINKDNKKLVQAAHPRQLNTLLRIKENLLQEIIPELELAHQFSEKKIPVEIYEGIPALRNIHLHYLEKKEDLLTMNIPKVSLPLVGPYFMEAFHKKRIKQGQKAYLIYNYDCEERVKQRNILPLTQARYLGPEFPGQRVTTRICGDEISITIYGGKEGENPTTITIQNKTLADGYREHFWALWDKAHEHKVTLLFKFS